MRSMESFTTIFNGVLRNHKMINHFVIRSRVFRLGHSPNQVRLGSKSTLIVCNPQRSGSHQLVILYCHSQGPGAHSEHAHVASYLTHLTHLTHLKYARSRSCCLTRNQGHVAQLQESMGPS
jgi:hypothetical protein